jgi:glycosyltransferase involved in cell wall biosynthesis
VKEPIPVAFYAPLKSPHHPSPSGDRTMARLLMKALAAAGFTPTLASELRTLDGAGDRAVQERLRSQSEQEADRLVAAYRSLPYRERPRLWFTYHVYYKAPDWIGPRVADALAIPYVVAEGSRAGKRARGPWAVGHRAAEAALDRADAVLVMTAVDREALERAKPPAQRLLALPPFMDLGEWDRNATPVATRRTRPPTADEPARLLTTAMMRRGDKLASYTILAEALGRLGAARWVLDIIGDGEVRDRVEQLFAPFGERVRFHGRIEERARMAALLGQADLFLWPAVNEAYGMALLEAQACGCPVVAGAYGGVASVVRDRVSGILTPPGDATAFAEAVGALLSDPLRRQALGAAARRFVTDERDLRHAAERLRTALRPLVREKAAP